MPIYTCFLRQVALSMAPRLSRGDTSKSQNKNNISPGLYWFVDHADAQGPLPMSMPMSMSNAHARLRMRPILIPTSPPFFSQFSIFSFFFFSFSLPR